MDDRTLRIGSEPIGRLLWSFSIPAILGMVFGSLYTIIDRLFVGNVVGADAIAGISVIMPISFVMMAFGMLIGIGSGALVSIRLGQQKKDEAEQILGNAFTLTLVFSFTLTPVFLFFLDDLLILLGASENVLPYARQFIQVILLGSFFQYAGFGLNAIIRAEGNPRLAMLTMLINAGLNIVLDALFIYLLGFGITGAAVATVISQAVSALWTLMHFRSRRSVLKLRFKHMRLRWAIIGPLFGIGLSPFVMHLGASVINLLFNQKLVRYGGDHAIGAFGIMNALNLFFLMPIFGLVQGAQPIIGYNYGARLFGRVRRTLWLTIGSSTAIVCIGFIAIESIPHILMGSFSSDPALVGIGSHGLRIYLCMLPIYGFLIVSSNFFQAIGKALIALVLTLLRQTIVLIPLLLILPHYFGLEGVWWAGPISDGTASLVTAFALLYQLNHIDRGDKLSVIRKSGNLLGKSQL